MSKSPEAPVDRLLREAETIVGAGGFLEPEQCRRLTELLGSEHLIRTLRRRGYLVYLLPKDREERLVAGPTVTLAQHRQMVVNLAQAVEERQEVTLGPVAYKWDDRHGYVVTIDDAENALALYAAGLQMPDEPPREQLHLVFRSPTADDGELTADETRAADQVGSAWVGIDEPPVMIGYGPTVRAQPAPGTELMRDEDGHLYETPLNTEPEEPPPSRTAREQLDGGERRYLDDLHRKALDGPDSPGVL